MSVVLGMAAMLPSACGLADSLDHAIRREMETSHVPAVQVAVVKHGRIVLQRTYGIGNLEFNSRATDDTRFEIASVSKMFAAAAIRILADEGKLDLEDPLSKYVPGIPDSWKSMRLRHLVGMTSGLPEDYELLGYEHDVPQDYTHETMLKMFFELPMVTPPGRKYHYSGPGYGILGIVVEKVSGKPLAQFVDERIFRPAGMSHTTYNDPYTVVPQRAEGYRPRKGVYLRGRYVSAYVHARADAGILSTAGDLARWVIALDQGKILKDPQRLWTELSTDDGKPTGYGYGWMILPIEGRFAVFHSGGFRTGFRSILTRLPDDDLSVAVLTNSDAARLARLSFLVAQHFSKRIVDLWDLAAEKDDAPGQTQSIVTALQASARGQTVAPMAPGALSLDAGHMLKENSTVLGQLRFHRRIGVEPGGRSYRGHRIAQAVILRAETPDGTRFVVADLATDGNIVAIELL